jgi:hypothetical protein
MYAGVPLFKMMLLEELAYRLPVFLTKGEIPIWE